MGQEIRAVLWDYGGVLSTSPFEAFARYEAERALPEGFIRRLNATNPDHNAWAALERGEIDLETFSRRFEEEARAAGGQLDALEVLNALRGELRPAMVEAVKRCRERRLKCALVTNNFSWGGDGGGRGGAVESRGQPQAGGGGGGEEAQAGGGGRAAGNHDGAEGDQGWVPEEVLALFDLVVESSKAGVRKPEPAFYRLACRELGIEPTEAVLLDDLGVNLKPAQEMGMRTIKVVEPQQALEDLEGLLGFPLR